MHVRIAWEILHHQKKDNPEKTATAGMTAKPTEMHRPPSHIYPSGSVLPRPHEMPSTFPGGMPGRPPYEAGPMPSSFLTGPTSHLGKKCRKAEQEDARKDKKSMIHFYCLYYMFLSH